MMKDLAKQEFLKDQAKLELGTHVQFFEFNMDDYLTFNTILGLIVALLLIFIPIPLDYVLSAYTGSFITLLLFYIKFGTNEK